MVTATLHILFPQTEKVRRRLTFESLDQLFISLGLSTTSHAIFLHTTTSDSTEIAEQDHPLTEELSQQLKDGDTIKVTCRDGKEEAPSYFRQDFPWANIQAEVGHEIDPSSETILSPDVRNKYDEESGLHWDKFYTHFENRFFRDRNYLSMVFEELFEKSRKNDKGENEETKGKTICEVGCGVGNTFFPLLKENASGFLYAFDISSSAIAILKKQDGYDTTRSHAFVWDIAGQEDFSSEFPVPLGSVDAVLLIFTLSAIDPQKHTLVASRLAQLLKPGGVLFFRDYGLYDLAQLRFERKWANKGKRCKLSENFYVKGDGTRVYFFSVDDVDKLFRGVGLVPLINKYWTCELVNNKRQLTMKRVWIHSKFEKPLEGARPSEPI